jgi:hypothetical protein
MRRERQLEGIFRRSEERNFVSVRAYRHSRQLFWLCSPIGGVKNGKNGRAGRFVRRTCWEMSPCLPRVGRIVAQLWSLSRKSRVGSRHPRQPLDASPLDPLLGLGSAHGELGAGAAKTWHGDHEPGAAQGQIRGGLGAARDLVRERRLIPGKRQARRRCGPPPDLEIPRRASKGKDVPSTLKSVS